MNNEFDRFIKGAAQEYVRGLEERGMRSNKTLEHAYVERLSQHLAGKAEENHRKRVEMIQRSHRQRDLAIRRRGASLALKTCPLVVALFGFMACFSFIHPGPLGMFFGVLYSIGALAFLVMLAIVLWQSRGA